MKRILLVLVLVLSIEAQGWSALLDFKGTVNGNTISQPSISTATDWNKWDGGSAGLTAETGRASLGLSPSDSPTFYHLTISTSDTLPTIGINRGSNGQNGTLVWSTGATTDFILGERNTSDSDLHIYSFGASKDVLAIARATGAVTMGYYGAGAATFDANGVISSASDARIKNVQGSFDAGLAEILALDPKLFTYKLESGLDTENIYAGLIAQNVMGVIPQAVGKNSDGLYSLQDRPIIAALINAIKALQAEIETLGGARVNPAVPQIGEAGIIHPTKH